jgi:hypothetical protein
MRFQSNEVCIYYRPISKYHLTEVKVTRAPELTEYYDFPTGKWFTSFCYRVDRDPYIAEVYELRKPHETPFTERTAKARRNADRCAVDCRDDDR